VSAAHVTTVVKRRH